LFSMVSSWKLHSFFSETTRISHAYGLLQLMWLSG
jgi:hypothetical protein